MSELPRRNQRHACPACPVTFGPFESDKDGRSVHRTLWNHVYTYPLFTAPRLYDHLKYRFQRWCHPRCRYVITERSEEA